MASSSSLTPISKRLEGEVAIITGGASGIGETTARLFVRHGAKVIIADVQDDLGQAICKDFNQDETISYVHCDVTSEDDVKNVVNFAMSKYGRLDIMFNNTGITGNVEPTILGTDNENFKKVFNVNVYGGFLAAKQAARVMIPAKKGQHDIRVNSVSPCAIATPLLTKAMRKDKEFVEEVVCSTTILKGVVPGVNDVAEAALFLSSSEAKYVSGLNLIIDGGYSTTNQSFTMLLKSYCLKS
ncbi:hypothetical protein Pint_36118 [Pistacia integerrima]|uniref:Uncharacterized protein n=1 Tax=Pistacia integerrima TaxID=434235 RepID=A0ACC0Y465_9ROSI|nr:hypothetical protein Pint_36118 [Pistacia integerrima]